MKFKNILSHGLNAAHSWLDDRLNARQEKQFIAALKRLDTKEQSPPLAKRLLLDGHFHNPGYWYRLQMFRTAIGSHQSEELGWIWKHNVQRCQRMFKNLGVNRTISLYAPNGKMARNEAKRVLGRIRHSADILTLQLPHEIPASFLYDAILKRQRLATVDIDDPLLQLDLQEFFGAIYRLEEVFSSYQPDAIALSHSIGPSCSPAAWMGAKAGLPVTVLFGNYGTLRFWRLCKPKDIFIGMDRPGLSDLQLLNPQQVQALSQHGAEYLHARLNGRTTDIGGAMAFNKAGADAALPKTWEGRPVVAVLASNWFDYPHSMGMAHFQDFLDWISQTVQVAKRTTDICWLFRGHPCDKWYGGMTLRDALPATLPENILLAPDDWSGSQVMSMASALVTYHGTAGIEYAAHGKPVLLADRGWYHDCGIAKLASSRDEYLEHLGTRWFDHVNNSHAEAQAKLYAGMYFCLPSWQVGQALPDDSNKRALRQVIINQNAHQLPAHQIELKLVRRWYYSAENGNSYHSFKMVQAEAYGLSNVET